jgi:hypothetical protein
MFSYITYGLRVNSELPLPELLPSEGTADAIISLGSLNPPSLEATSTNCYCHISAEAAYLFWEEAGTFLVRGGREIIVDPIPGVEERVLRLYILGAALGLLLHQRGLLVLHASTVALDGSAIAFVGERGWGKSTTAGALHVRGHRIIADDITAVDLDNTSSPMVLPGFGQLKLWPEAATALGSSPETLPQLHPQFEKRAYPITKKFSSTPLPLKSIYILDAGPVLEIEHLPAQEALPALMPHWYCARFGAQMLQATGISSHFLKCTHLVNHVSVYRLHRQRSLSMLDAIAQLVESHLIHQSNTATQRQPSNRSTGTMR